MKIEVEIRSNRILVRCAGRLDAVGAPDLEAAVAQLGYETVVIAQPSLLLGDRGALGQPARRAEDLATRFLGPMSWIVPRGVRPISARSVAAAMFAEVLAASPGVWRLKSGAMQGGD